MDIINNLNSTKAEDITLEFCKLSIIFPFLIK
jgi:hypothetical protein